MRQGGQPQMRYTDYLTLIKPRSADFADYVSRRMNEDCATNEPGGEQDGFAMKNETKLKFSKLFKELV